jgi:RimJ/RimL family protein N-acetyltransferase
VSNALSGERVLLRPPRTADLDVLYEIASDLDSWEQRGGQPPRPLTRERYAEGFTKALTDDGPDASFVIEVDGAVIGRCGIFQFDELARSAEVGIALHPDRVGQGYGTDAMRVLVRFGFERCHLNRIHLTVLASNAGAVASYRKVGFVEEGRLRESAWLRGGYEDELRMSLLRSDWAE